MASAFVFYCFTFSDVCSKVADPSGSSDTDLLVTDRTFTLFESSFIVNHGVVLGGIFVNICTIGDFRVYRIMRNANFLVLQATINLMISYVRKHSTKEELSELRQIALADLRKSLTEEYEANSQGQVVDLQLVGREEFTKMLDSQMQEIDIKLRQLLAEE